MIGNRKPRVRIGEPPAPVTGINDCIICGFEAKSSMGLHKLRPHDLALVQKECDMGTTKRRVTKAVWNTCCGSFKEYEVELIKDWCGKPYRSNGKDLEPEN